MNFFYYGLGMAGFSGCLLLSSLAASVPEVREGISVFYAIVFLVLIMVAVVTLLGVKSKKGRLKGADVAAAVAPTAMVAIFLSVLILVGIWVSFR